MIYEPTEDDEVIELGDAFECDYEVTVVSERDHIIYQAARECLESGEIATDTYAGIEKYEIGVDEVVSAMLDLKNQPGDEDTYGREV